MFNDTATKIIFLLMCIVFGLAMMLMVTERLIARSRSSAKAVIQNIHGVKVTGRIKGGVEDEKD